MPKAKTKYKHLNDISRRHFNRLVKQESTKNGASTSKVGLIECNADSLTKSKTTMSPKYECESDVSSECVFQMFNENVECKSGLSSENGNMKTYIKSDSNNTSTASEVYSSSDSNSETGSNSNFNDRFPTGEIYSSFVENEYESGNNSDFNDRFAAGDVCSSGGNGSERGSFSNISCNNIDHDDSLNRPIDDIDSKLTNCSPEYMSKLANWAVTFQVKNNALNALLQIQRSEPGYEQLPKDSRTLLSTPRSTTIRKVNPGEYYHYGLENCLNEYLMSIKTAKPTNIEVFVGIDGLPISNSGSSQVWPILCYFKNNLNTDRSKVFTIGIYHGYEKPYCSNDFLNDFQHEMMHLTSNGLKDNDSNVIFVKLSAIICDAPAKSFVLKTKGHTGFYSCSKCLQKGVTVSNRTCFPEINCELRTHDSFVNQDQVEYHSGTSNLVGIPNFDLIKCVPLDYMHLICLGVVKKLMHMWLFKVKGSHRLPNQIVQSASETLCTMTEYIPVEFARKPRSLFESNRWKATELRQFLLYTGPIVLKSTLSKDLYLHFLALSIAVSIMLSEKYHLELLDYADSLLRWFVQSFSNIYGRQYVSHNVHALIHLKADVIQFGTLNGCSAFPFESFMFSLKKLLIRKPYKPLQQFARRQVELCKAKPDLEKEQCYPILKGLHFEGPLVENMSGFQYKQVHLQGYVLTIFTGNNCCKFSDGSIVKIDNIVERDGSIMILGKAFSKVSEFFTEPCNSSLLGIFKVSDLSSLKSWNLADVVLKCILLPYSDGFVVYPLLHQID
ncbi:uncharacterized protein LOC128985493 [Macrosteles quadrilineatus]|uniref:uncharacterized protein LOC128985493 n=1 Tax=Macrosteles quadrilineatus TaxID=74068 RepID=UPI0023E1CAC8|nr:uncharacterized protein LOC128985493 [Macrosteles quadrilineatus]